MVALQEYAQHSLLSYRLCACLSAHIKRLHQLLLFYDDLARSVKASVTQFPYLV